MAAPFILPRFARWVHVLKYSVDDTDFPKALGICAVITMFFGMLVTVLVAQRKRFIPALLALSVFLLLAVCLAISALGSA